MINSTRLHLISFRLPLDTATVIISIALFSAAASANPKYAATTIPAFESQEFLRQSPAPDFWALAFHYVPQAENFCQTASMAMVFNALRDPKLMTSETKNILQSEIVAKLNDPDWTKAMVDKKCYSLDKFAEIVRKGIRIFLDDQYTVRVVHMSADPKAAATALADLATNEKSARNFMIANFDQAVLTGESEPAGHISPVGAYDAKTKRVLIMDVDREWYTPYWVPQSQFLKSMAALDKGAAKPRGYLMIEPKNESRRVTDE